MQREAFSLFSFSLRLSSLFRNNVRLCSPVQGARGVGAVDGSSFQVLGSSSGAQGCHHCGSGNVEARRIVNLDDAFDDDVVVVVVVIAAVLCIAVPPPPRPSCPSGSALGRRD